jgi:hypothetical protein
MMLQLRNVKVHLDVAAENRRFTKMLMALAVQSRQPAKDVPRCLNAILKNFRQAIDGV